MIGGALTGGTALYTTASTASTGTTVFTGTAVNGTVNSWAAANTVKMQNQAYTALAQGTGSAAGYVSVPAYQGIGQSMQAAQLSQPIYSNVDFIAVNEALQDASVMPSLSLQIANRMPRRKLWDGRLVDQHPFVAELQASWDYRLPDGTELSVDKDGNYQIRDDAARVIYKANRIHEFNRYINASDLLEEFIRDLGQAGVTQDKVLKVPIGIFVHWLILKAAEADGDQPPADVPRLDAHPQLAPLKVAAPAPTRPSAPKCLCCGRFLSKLYSANGVNFCSDKHMRRYVARLKLPAIRAASRPYVRSPVALLQ